MPIIYNNCVFYFVNGSDELYDSDNDGREDKLKIESKLMKYDMEKKPKKFLSPGKEAGANLCLVHIYINMFSPTFPRIIR